MGPNFRLRIIGFLLLLIITSGTAEAMNVTAPTIVRPGETYRITVLAQPFEQGSLTITGGNLVIAEIDFTTDIAGVFEYVARAPTKEQLMRVQVITNSSGAWNGQIDVIAKPCTEANAPKCLAFLGPTITALMSQIAVLLIIVLLLINAPAIAIALKRYSHEARLNGSPSVMEIAKSPFNVGWLLLHPARQTPHKDVLPNDRLAIDLKRRDKLDEIIQVARFAGKFDYQRSLALFRKVKEYFDLFRLERSVVGRQSQEVLVPTQQKS